MIPEPWEFILIAAAAFRLWKLIADDRILDRPRDWLLKRIEGKRGKDKGVYWSDFLTCPWCAGFWLSLAAYILWIALGPGVYEQGDVLMGATVVLAVSALVGALGTIYYAITDE